MRARHFRATIEPRYATGQGELVLAAGASWRLHYVSSSETRGFVCSRLLVRSNGDVRYFVLIIHEEYGGIA
jgi:hypothetical protein